MLLRHLCFALLFIFSACPWAVAQTCQSETAVPSTTPDSRFLVHGEGTVTDTVTGLMWARCAEGLSGPACADGTVATFTWAEALTRARDSNHAGYGDWRLPTVKELTSIVEVRCAYPAINSTVFPNTSASSHWSASPSGVNAKYAYEVHFGRGHASISFGFREGSPYLRLVWSGQ